MDETQESVLNTLNYYQDLAKDRKQGHPEYWAIHHMIDRLVGKLTTVYEVDPVLNPRENTWQLVQDDSGEVQA